MWQDYAVVFVTAIEAEFAQASANRLGIASLVLGAVQPLYVPQRAVGRSTADGHAVQQYTLPLVALLAATPLVSLGALPHPAVGRARPGARAPSRLGRGARRRRRARFVARSVVVSRERAVVAGARRHRARVAR